jgi:hypothetical protein
MSSYDVFNHQPRVQDVPDTQGMLENPPNPEVDLNVELEDRYRAHQDPWYGEGLRNMAYFFNMQFTQRQLRKLALRAQAATPINILYPAAEQAVAMLTTNSPRFVALPREDSDVRTARAMAELMGWVWYTSDGNTCLKEALYDYYIKGRGCLFAYMDPNADLGKGEVKLINIDPFSVYPDPNSRDRLWRDAANVITSRTFTREQIEIQWPDARELLKGAPESHDLEYDSPGTVASQGQTIGPVTSDAYHERYKVIDRYTKVKVKYFRVSEPFPYSEDIFLEEEIDTYLSTDVFVMEHNGEVEYALDEETIAQVQPFWDEGIATENPNARLVPMPPTQDPQTGEPVEQPPVAIFATTKGELVNRGVIEMQRVVLNRIKRVMTIGDRLYFEGIMPIEEYPIVPIANRQDRNPYPMSDVSFVRPMQDSLNKIHMLMIANASSSTNVKVFVPEGSADLDRVERDLAKAGHAVIPYDASEGQITIAAPTPLPTALYTQFQLLQTMIERTLGVYSVNQGDPSQAPPTYRGLLQIDEMGQRRIKSKLDDVEASLNQIGRVIVPMIQLVYTKEKIVRLIQPNNKISETIMNQYVPTNFGDIIGSINNIQQGRYDVVVASGSTLPTNRSAERELYLEYYKMGIVDQIAVLQKSDIADAEEIVNRSGQISQLLQQVQGLEEENKKLKGDLQTAQREEIHAKKRLAVQKFEGDIGIAREQAKQAVQLYKARQADELSLARAQRPKANA